ncbi:tetratricopeptide repeat protein [Paraburkholderia kururiensis]|uniref:tetratricopeptide repeat protein n=1 Tax=Paraburkholderia kururiensis TaxID=984307 RepID=UPI0005A92F86|nr:tetratricopeptide repeat protein [Paraburkholderia kururiensis]
MENSGAIIRSHPAEGNTPDEQDVRDELARVLKSHCFATSGRMRALLDYLVNETLQGRGDRLKEYTIGIEVFDRGTDFDPRIETVVRTEAWRLRSRLTLYYQTEGAHNPVRIELAKRSFATAAYRVATATPALAFADLPPQRIARLAVLPFAVTDDAPDIGHFAASLADETSHALARLPRIEVLARSLCRAMPATAASIGETVQRLDVDWIMEGSVRRSGARIRVLVQLVETTSGCQVWAHAIEQDWNDGLPRVEDTAAALVTELAKSERIWQTPLAEAFVEDVCSGSDLRQLLRFGTGGSPSIVDVLRRGIGWLEGRLQRDPHEAAMHASMANLLAAFVSIVPGSSADLMPRLKRSAMAAATAPRSGTRGLVALGMASLFVCDWVAAQDALDRAIRLTPDDSGARMCLGLLHLQTGKLGEALDNMREARDLHPLSATVTGSLAAVLMNSRRYGEAMELARRAVALDSDFQPAHVLLADAMLWDGRISQALGRFEEISQLNGRSAFGLGKMGYAYGKTGNGPKARAILDELDSRDDDPGRTLMAKAQIHLSLGEHNAAFEHLDAALGAPTAPELLLRTAPQFDPLRADPRFARLLARLGLTACRADI